MTKYAVFDADGLPQAFYAPDVHGERMRPVYGPRPPIYGDPVAIGLEEDGVTPILQTNIVDYGPAPVIGEETNPECRIPAEAIAITDDQWAEFLNHPGARRWNGFAVMPYEPPPLPVTASEVIAERSRRLALGFDYNFGDARGIHRIGTSAADKEGWDDVTTLANALIALGDTGTTIAALTDTGPVQVTALEWQSILVAAGQFRQPIWAASFGLQAMDPIPADYVADHYWQ